MLGKLIKHELKATWKMVTLMNVFLLVLTALGVLSFAFKFWNVDNDIMMAFGVLSLVFYYLSILVISIAVCIYVAVRFYRTLYSDEGYLTNTLPVTNHQLLISKILVGTIYEFVTSVVIIVSVIALFFSLIMQFDAATISEIQSVMNEIFAAINGEMHVSIPVLIAECIIFFIVSCFSSIITFFGAISLGQLYQKHKVLGSIIAYFAIVTVIQIISTIISIPTMVYASVSNANATVVSMGTFWFTMILTVVVSIALYFTSAYIIKNKLNLD